MIFPQRPNIICRYRWRLRWSPSHWRGWAWWAACSSSLSSFGFRTSTNPGHPTDTFFLLRSVVMTINQKKKESKIFSRAFFQIFDLKYNVSRFILVFWYRVYHNNQLLWFACIHQPQIQFSNFPRIQASLDLKCSTFAWSSSIHSLICCVCYCQVHPPGERVVRKFPDPAHLHHALHLPLLGQGPALQV